MPIFDPNDAEFQQQIGKLTYENFIDDANVKNRLTSLFSESFKTIGKLASLAGGDMEGSFGSAFSGLLREGKKTFKVLFSDVSKTSAFSQMSKLGVAGFGEIASQGRDDFEKLFSEVAGTDAFYQVSDKGRKYMQSLFDNSDKALKSFLSHMLRANLKNIKTLEGKRDKSLKDEQKRQNKEAAFLKKTIKNETKLREKLFKKRVQWSKKLLRIRTQHERKITAEIKRSGLARRVTAPKGGPKGAVAGGMAGGGLMKAGAAAGPYGLIIAGILAAIVGVLAGSEARLRKKVRIGAKFEAAGITPVGTSGVLAQTGKSKIPAIEQVTAMATEMAGLSGQKIDNVRDSLVSMAAQSPQAIKESLEGSGLQFKKFAGFMGNFGINIDSSSKLFASSARDMNISLEDITDRSIFAAASLTKTGLTIQDTMNVILGMERSMRGLTFEGERAQDVFMAVVPTLREIGFSATEVTKFSDSISSWLGNMKISNLAGVIALSTGKFPTEADVDRLASQPLQLFMGAFKPIMDAYSGDAFKRQLALSAMAGQLDLTGFANRTGAQALDNILQQSAFDMEGAATKFEEEKTKLADLLKEEKLSDLEKAGYDVLTKELPIMSEWLNKINNKIVKILDALPSITGAVTSFSDMWGKIKGFSLLEDASKFFQKMKDVREGIKEKAGQARDIIKRTRWFFPPFGR